MSHAFARRASSSQVVCCVFFGQIPSESERVVVAFTGPDPNHRLNRRNPDLAVADLAGAGRADDGVSDPLGKLGVDQYLDADLRDELDRVLRPAVDLGVTALPAVSLDLRDGQTQHADGLHGMPDVVEREGL